MSKAVVRLILLVSCAHALVHVYELALPSVEQQIAKQYFPGDEAAGKALTGRLSNYWRLTWGLGALAAGWLVDRLGSRRMLAAYLLGCGALCLVVAWGVSLPLLTALMLAMGAFACIYHPAGLALISHSTTPANRPRALGIHGIFGSTGIAAAPFLAGALTAAGCDWRQYYLVLALPGALLGLIFASKIREDAPDLALTRRRRRGETPPDKPGQWRSYFTLILLAVTQGFIYCGVLSFLPRYISGWRPGAADAEHLSQSGYLTAGVLLLGCIGQYASGRFARPWKLERQLMFITLANAPFLLWMAAALHADRLLAAGCFSVVHFMHQPIYNSLIAKYTPRRRRSLCYGLSFAMGLGLGSFGARFVGYSPSDATAYSVLAAVALAGGALAGLLWLWNRGAREDASGAVPGSGPKPPPHGSPC